MALVLLPVALSWPVFLAGSLAFLTALLVIQLEPTDRRLVYGTGAALALATLPVVLSGIAVDCSSRCFAIECWWFCL